MVRIVCTFLLYLAFLVPAVSAKEAVLPEKQQARGIIVAKRQPVISSEIAGRIEKIAFRDGEYFKKGDLLVAFNKQLLSAQKNKVEAELDGAQLKLDNFRQLERLESIGALEVSLAEVEVKKLHAEMEITDIALNRCRIKAPFNGRVVALLVDEYESVGPNQKLLEIISTDELELEVMVPAAWLNWLSPNQTFAVTVDTLSIELEAQIISLGATVDPVSGLLKFRGKFSSTETGLLPGMMATVLFAPAK
jgi:membrane fusion protein (multidrug efflux system)